MGAYNSQQATFQAFLVSYLQNPTNWQNGVPRITDFSPGSVAYTWCAAVAALADMLAYAQWQTNQQALISTATGSGLDAKAADFGITRKQAVAASGIFTFGKNTPAISATDIPAGTLISTFPDANGNVVTFATNADASLPAGQTSVQVLATAQMAGSSGNLAANTPLVLSSAVPGIDTVTLTTDVANGADQEDVSRRPPPPQESAAEPGAGRVTSAVFQHLPPPPGAFSHAPPSPDLTYIIATGNGEGVRP